MRIFIEDTMLYDQETFEEWLRSKGMTTQNIDDIEDMYTEDLIAEFNSGDDYELFYDSLTTNVQNYINELHEVLVALKSGKGGTKAQFAEKIAKLAIEAFGEYDELIIW